MQVKRYVAPNMRLALQRVREEVGSDAVILSSKRLPEGVEVMTAIEAGADEHNAAEASVNDNPFDVDDTALVSKQKPSKLELEMEQMQHSYQQRARALAESIAKQNSQLQQQVEEEQSRSQEQTLPEKESVQPLQQIDDVVTLNSTGPSVSGKNVAGSDNEMAEMRRELQSMRELLEQQLSSMAWGNYRQQHPQQASLWRRMKRMGLSASVSKNLLDNLADSACTDTKDLWQFLMTGLKQALPVAADDLVSRGGVFALVGPTGAGKTTTIGKLATRYVLDNGPEKVALVTTDTARIAAHEQLRIFGRILNVPVKVVDKNNSLEQVLYSLRHKSLVLVDTAGLNRHDKRLDQQLHLLNEISGNIQTILTIPATSQEAVLRAAYHAYKTDNLAACILTKLDEAASVGEALSLVVEKNLPLAYSTHGQGVPDDIAVADSVELIRLAIEMARQMDADDGVMADEMASLAHS